VLELLKSDGDIKAIIVPNRPKTTAKKADTQPSA
jgi:hypothetical protein